MICTGLRLDGGEGGVLNELAVRFFDRDWGQVLLTSAFGIILLAFIGAPRAVSEIIGLALQATFDGNAWPILALGAFPIGLLARDLRETGILLTLGIIGLSISAPNLNSDPEKLGLTLIGLVLFLTATTALTRCAKHFYLSANQIPASDSVEEPSEAKFAEEKPERKFGITISVIIVALFIGNFITHEGFSHYSKYNYSGYLDNQASTEAAEVGAYAAAPSAEAAAEVRQADSSIPVIGSYDTSQMPVWDNVIDTSRLGSLNDSGDAKRYSTSFDCTNATKFIENSICTNQKLAEFDIELHSMFKQKLDGLSGKTRRDFLATEGRKLAERGRCTTISCIEDWYVRELSQPDKSESTDTMIKTLDKILKEEPRESSDVLKQTTPSANEIKKTD
jgi:hypothetical protein